jgi:hypothetical protein
VPAAAVFGQFAEQFAAKRLDRGITDQQRTNPARRGSWRQGRPLTAHPARCESFL